MRLSICLKQQRHSSLRLCNLPAAAAAAKGLSSTRLVPSPRKRQPNEDALDRQVIADRQYDQQNDSDSDTSSQGTEHGEPRHEPAPIADIQDAPQTPPLPEPASRARLRLELNQTGPEALPDRAALRELHHEPLNHTLPVNEEAADLQPLQMDRAPAAHTPPDSDREEPEPETVQEGQ